MSIEVSNEERKAGVAEVQIKPILSPKELEDVDQGFQYVLETEGLELDPEFEKKVIRKIDLNILPMMCILMSCQLMDKSTNSYASITGLRTDLNMDTRTYSWVASSFYLGYLVFCYPASMMLQRFPLSKTLGVAVILWGVVICCHGATHSSSTFLLCRTFLGIFESFMDPAYMIMTSQWYKKEEQYRRCGVWLGFQGFGTMLGSLIAYGFYKHKTSYSMAPWRLLYIVTGVITIFFGLISLIHVPDIPVKAWFLNDKEKHYVVERIRKNKTGFGNPHFKLSQLKEAVFDVTTYLFFLYMFSYGVTNGSLGNFGSILLNDEFGFTTSQSLLLNLAGSGIDIIFPLAFAYLNLYLIPSRLVVCSIINALIFTGVCMLAFAPGNGPKMTGFYLTYLTTASWACMSSVVSSNVAGHTKKITENTVFLVGFAAGNIVGPQMFLGSQAPVYGTAKRGMVGTYVISAIAPAILLFIYSRRNSKKAGLSEEVKEDELVLSFGDKTDKQNPEFLYIL